MPKKHVPVTAPDGLTRAIVVALFTPPPVKGIVALSSLTLAELADEEHLTKEQRILIDQISSHSSSFADALRMVGDARKHLN